MLGAETSEFDWDDGIARILLYTPITSAEVERAILDRDDFRERLLAGCRYERSSEVGIDLGFGFHLSLVYVKGILARQPVQIFAARDPKQGFDLAEVSFRSRTVPQCRRRSQFLPRL